METTVEHYSSVDPQLLETIAALDKAIFPKPISQDEFAQALRSRHNLCILVAFRGGEPCGFKIGYEYSPDVFYSFTGGVLPLFRRQGIAQALMSQQHQIAQALGYALVRTHTKNKYRDMLILNIRAGFDITGVNHKSGEHALSIILEKGLASTTGDVVAKAPAG